MKSILLDTDIGPDCDDVGAIALLNIFMNQGYCKILGIGHCTSNPYGAGAIDAICRYYGHPNVEIGTYSGKDFLNLDRCKIYNKPMTEQFPNRYRYGQPEDAVKLYRRILSNQPDNSVEFVAIGPLNNLSDLLDSDPDEFSGLNGRDLVRKKVIRLIAMAGIFPSANAEACEAAEKLTGRKIENMPEFNVWCSIPSAQNVAEHWPTPKIYLGFEAGMLETGAPVQKILDGNHPVKFAYGLYTPTGNRYSWDLLTVEYAVVEESPHYRLSEPGEILFNEKGQTSWKPCTNGRDRFIEWAQPAEHIVEDINKLLLTGTRQK